MVVPEKCEGYTDYLRGAVLVPYEKVNIEVSQISVIGNNVYAYIDLQSLRLVINHRGNIFTVDMGDEFSGDEKSVVEFTVKRGTAVGWSPVLIIKSIYGVARELYVKKNGVEYGTIYGKLVYKLASGGMLVPNDKYAIYDGDYVPLCDYVVDSTLRSSEAIDVSDYGHVITLDSDTVEKIDNVELKINGDLYYDGNRIDSGVADLKYAVITDTGNKLLAGTQDSLQAVKGYYDFLSNIGLTGYKSEIDRWLSENTVSCPQWAGVRDSNVSTTTDCSNYKIQKSYLSSGSYLPKNGKCRAEYLYIKNDGTIRSLSGGQPMDAVVSDFNSDFVHTVYEQGIGASFLLGTIGSFSPSFMCDTEGLATKRCFFG